MSLYKEKLGGEGELTPPEGQIHFKTSKAMSGVNFFTKITDPDYDFSFLQVYVNDELTDIPANALTAAAGDDIRIVSLSKPYPFFYPYYKDYIASIEEPLPFMGETNFSDYFYYCRSLVSIPENLFINNPQITNFSRCFRSCRLTSIPEGLFANNPNVTSFSYCFFYCISITSIPEGLFANNPNVTDFRYCFENCEALTSIPEGLFVNNPNVTEFDGCFSYCEALISIPVGLFANNPNVTDFSSCFSGCSALISIPQGLFDNNPNVTDFGSCFRNCNALTSIPVGLFANNPNVTDFNTCFSGCSTLTSIPVGLFDNNPNVTDFSSCFYNCTKLKVNVQIGSTTTKNVWVDDFAERTAAKGTVYCRAGSNAYNAFLEDTTANVNVLTY